jgi:hypothetical protein
MFQKCLTTCATLTLAAALWLLPAATAAFEGTRFLYLLSDLNGYLPFNAVTMRVDRQHDELYLYDQSVQAVRVFNTAGMEIYHFNSSDYPGRFLGLFPTGHGELLILTDNTGVLTLFSCDERGKPKSSLIITNSTDREFHPDLFVGQGDRLYLADRARMLIVVCNKQGGDQQLHDIAARLELTDAQRDDAGLTGFNVTPQGEILFTVATEFRAGRIALNGAMRTFGSKGSTPGKFNIVGGIAADDAGNIYVAETLRCTIIVFDNNGRFLQQISQRGEAPNKLIGPDEIMVLNDRLYVSQMRARGVSVFRIAAHPKGNTPPATQEGGDT